MARRLPPRSVRTAIASMGGNTTHFKHDSKEIAARARAGFDKRFHDEAARQFPDAPPDVIAQKAKHLRKLYFTGLTLKRLRKQQSARPPDEGGA